MHLSRYTKKLACTVAALTLCANSTAAVAASTPNAARAAMDPLVALSVFGSDASRAALCGAAASATAAAAVAGQAAQAAAPGCVLPVVDVPPPAVVETLPPPPVAPPPVVASGGGFAISPLILGLLGIGAAILAVTLLRDKDKDEDENEASPS
jgi:hypothetical protein